MWNKILNIFTVQINPTTSKFVFTNKTCSEAQFKEFESVLFDVILLFFTLILNIMLVRIIVTVDIFKQTFYKVFCTYSISSYLAFFTFAIPKNAIQLAIICPNLTTFLHYHGRFYLIFYLPRSFFAFASMNATVWIAIQGYLVIKYPQKIHETIICKSWLAHLLIFGISAITCIPLCWTRSYVKTTTKGFLYISDYNDLHVSHLLYYTAAGLLAFTIIFVLTLATIIVALRNTKVLKLTGSRQILQLGLITSMLTCVLAIGRLALQYTFVNKETELRKIIHPTLMYLQKFVELSPTWWLILIDSKLRRHIWTSMFCRKVANTSTISQDKTAVA